MSVPVAPVDQEEYPSVDCVLDESTFVRLLADKEEIVTLLDAHSLERPIVSLDAWAKSTIDLVAHLAEVGDALDEGAHLNLSSYLFLAGKLAHTMPGPAEISFVVRWGARLAEALLRLDHIEDNEELRIKLVLACERIYAASRAYHLDIPIVTMRPSDYIIWKECGVRIVSPSSTS